MVLFTEVQSYTEVSSSYLSKSAQNTIKKIAVQVNLLFPASYYGIDGNPEIQTNKVLPDF